MKTHLLSTLLLLSACSSTKETSVSPDKLKELNLEPCISENSATSDEKSERGSKRLWAASAIWTEAPALEVEKWISEKPELKNKYILVEFWNTWCPHCVRSLELMNYFHHKFKDNLAVIVLCDEEESKVKAMMTNSHPIECYNAIDTQGRMKKALKVIGVPHAIIIEPQERTIIWEGYPLLKDYELTEKTIQNIIDVGRANGIIK